MSEERSNGFTAWRVAELLFGGGVIVWAFGSGVAAIWWASDTNARLLAAEQAIVKSENKIDNLDNAVLGNRIAVVETRVGGLETGISRVDQKLDRILARQLVDGPNR